MSNENGLISSNDVSATGATGSNFFLRKGVPLAVPSPFQIISPDTTDVAVLSVDNNGSFVLTSNSIALEAQNNFNIAVGNATGGGAGFLSKPVDQVAGAGGISIFNGSASATPTYFTTFNASVNAGGLTAGNLQTFGYSGANVKEITSFTADGSSAIVGDASTVGGAVLSVNGPQGPSRVFDPKYNPVPVIPAVAITTVFTTEQALEPGLIQSQPFVLPPGFFQLQAQIVLQNLPPFNLPVNGFITAYVELQSFASINVSAVQLAVPASGTGNAPSFASGIFGNSTLSTTTKIVLEIDGSWNFGDGGQITFQIVKFG